MTKRVIEGEQSIMGTIFFIFKVNTVEKVLRDLFQLCFFSIGNAVCTFNAEHNFKDVRC